MLEFQYASIDASRSRVLSRTARKYNSQALEAGAPHFPTDIRSSAVVIAGLVVVKAGEWFPGHAFLSAGDALAAHRHRRESLARGAGLPQHPLPLLRTLKQVHLLTVAIETAIEQIALHADVTVHPEPG